MLISIELGAYYRFFNPVACINFNYLIQNNVNTSNTLELHFYVLQKYILPQNHISIENCFFSNRMDSLFTKNDAAPSIEFSSTIDDKKEITERGYCWKYNVSEQFPVKCELASADLVTIKVAKPHEGYSIVTTIRNSKMNGIAAIFSDCNVRIADLYFMDGIACGPCTLYDDDGLLFFEGLW